MSDSMTPAVPDPTVEALNPDPLWVRMVMDVADQLWQAGNKRASSDLHEALRRSAEHTERAVREALEAAAVRVEAEREYDPAEDNYGTTPQSLRDAWKGGRP